MSGDLSDVNYLSEQMELLCGEMEAAGVPRPIISPINSSKGENLLFFEEYTLFIL